MAPLAKLSLAALLPVAAAYRVDLESSSQGLLATDGALSKNNPCKDVKGSVCKTMSTECDWDWDAQAKTGHCWPKSCKDIKGSDCRELKDRCKWEWHADQQRGDCLDAKAQQHAEPAKKPAKTPAADSRSNPCKDLKGSICRTKGEECSWDWNKETSTGNCRPLTCEHIKGSDCILLTEQCDWIWHGEFAPGECKNKPAASKDIAPAKTKTTTTTSAAAAKKVPAAPAQKLKDNVCKGLAKAACKAKPGDCRCEGVACGTCLPKTCVGIKGSDCRLLPLVCEWRWDQASKTGQCLTKGAAPATATKTTTSGAAVRGAWALLAALVALLSA